MQHLLIALNAKYAHTNLAVRNLQNALTAANISAQFVEYTINQPPREILADLVRQTGAAETPCFLFSCYLWNIELVEKLGVELRLLYPRCRIVLGGPEVSFEAESLLPTFPFADVILCGEGEELIVPLLQDCTLRGVFVAKAPVNLDRMPFPYRDLAALRNRVLYYEASRGCPFGCSYCLSSADKLVRRRSLPLVLSDLQNFLDAGVMQVKFVDRTFNLDADRATEIWRYLIEHDNGHTSFQMEVGGDLFTEKQLFLLAKARLGLFQLEVGVQSTCSLSLQNACRSCDWSILQRNMRALASQGNIHLHLDLICGLPGEGFERFLKSYDDVFSIAPEQLQLGFLKLLRGSTLYGRRTEFALLHSPYPPYEILSTNEISFVELARIKKLEEMTEIYYNSGRFAFQLDFLLKKVSSPARFFLSLADSLPAEKLSKYAYYDALYRFGAAQGADSARLRWLMRFDLCLHERLRKLPEHCAPGLLEEGRTAAATLGIAKTLPVEVFPFDPTAFDNTEHPTLFLFDYSQRNLRGHAFWKKYSL